jgi:hypothetical protein
MQQLELSMETAGHIPGITDVLDKPLHNRSMNASLHFSAWQARKTDKKLEKKAAEDTHSDASMHKHQRRILAKNALADIQKVIGQARTFHYENTSPWEDGGLRILSAKNYFEYMNKMAEFERQFHTAIDTFIPNYPKLIEEAKVLLGDTYNGADYPHPMEIRRLFTFSVHITGLSTAADFRVPEIGEEAQTAIRNEIDRRTAEAINNVVRDLWAQAQAHVAHMVEGLTRYNEKVEKEIKGGEGTFRDTLVDNLREYVARLPRLNLTDDRTIEQLRTKLMRELCREDAETLRDSPLVRKDVLGKAKKILDEVSEFLA